MMPILSVDTLKTHFHTREGVVRAVDGVSFEVARGEMVGIVGESGCGKSVTVYSILGLVPTPPGRIEGHALFEGTDLIQCDAPTLRAVRGRRIAMIFQDPMTALNPYLRIGDQVMEPMRIHGICDRHEAKRRAVEALEAVGIPDAAARLNAYPHEFSGGMRQRVMIAMALVARPEVLIADEPTTALDVTVQAQILDLIRQLQKDLGMAVILITHDMGVVAGTCDRVLVMYAGRIVESAHTDALFGRPRHPYTQALMDALPAANTKGQDLRTIPGLPPNLAQPIEGCPFAPRCPHVADLCRATTPTLECVGENHHTACLRVQAGEL